MCENFWFSEPDFLHVVEDGLNSVDRAAVDLLLDFIPNRLSVSDIHSFEQPFTSEEVKTALFHMAGDKALGLDGINARLLINGSLSDSFFLLEGFQDLSKDDLRFFLGISWEIWNRRNIRLFNKHKVSFSSAEFQVSCMLQIMMMLKSPLRAPNSHTTTLSSNGASSQSWPKQGILKLHVDLCLE
uniref:Uncharacterized protein n=1 Tax=Cannabis sativa TaxID=3483 RepID=A0A803NTQ1_CANSA